MSLRALTAAFVICWLLGFNAQAGTLPGHLEFELLRDGHAFGRQSVRATQRGGALVAETRASLHAGLGPITLFSYTQQCSETWTSGALTGLRCLTRKNGRNTNVSGTSVDGRLRVSGVGGAASFPLTTLPTSWWTRPPLNTREMVNTETGARLPVRVSLIGRETVTANGRPIAADHIRVHGTLTVDLWYDDTGHWVSCAFVMQGQHITYRLLTPPGGGPA